MPSLNTTPGQRAVSVDGTTAVTIADSGTWNDADSLATSDRIVKGSNCGTTVLYLAIVVAAATTNAAAVRAAYLYKVAAGDGFSVPLKAGESLRVVRASGAATEVVVAKIYRGAL